jgi:hypothetical protein
VVTFSAVTEPVGKRGGVTVTGVRPAGHRSQRPLFAVAVGCWALAAVALPVSMNPPLSSESVGLAAEVAFMAAMLTALGLTTAIARRGVEIIVAAGEVRVGERRLPRTGLAIKVEGAGQWPRGLLLDAPGQALVRLRGTRWLVPWPGSARGAEAVVPRVLLARLAEELTGLKPAGWEFRLVRTGRIVRREAVVLAAALVLFFTVNVTRPGSGPVVFTLMTMFDVAVIAAVIVAVLARTAPPRPVQRQLTVDELEVRCVDVYTGRLIQRANRFEVTLERRSWVRPRFRRFPPASFGGVRIRLGTGVLDVVFPELSGEGDTFPRMREPRWMTEPGRGHDLIRMFAQQE